MRKNMIWIRWGIQTLTIMFTIILGMVYGWGLVPKRWSIVIISYLIANALIPFCAFLNSKLAKKMGWEVPAGYHLHKNPIGSGRRKKVGKSEGLEHLILKDYETSHLKGKFPGKNMGD